MTRTPLAWATSWACEVNGLLALAFAAGMLAPVNPCGFALLPAWITYTLGTTDASPVPLRLARAARSGAALTIGFAGTLVTAGLIISAGARVLITAAPCQIRCRGRVMAPHTNSYNFANTISPHLSTLP
jgi:cytochrome c biogenesis protein CcdA